MNPQPFKVIIVLDSDIYLSQRQEFLHKTGIKTNVAFDFTTNGLKAKYNCCRLQYCMSGPWVIGHNPEPDLI